MSFNMSELRQRLKAISEEADVDMNKWKKDVDAVSKIQVLDIAKKFAGEDFSNKDTVVKFVIAVMGVAKNLREILERYQNMTSNDGSPTAIGSEKLKAALAQFYSTLPELAQDIKSVSEAPAYKDGYDVIEQKLKMTKSVLDNILHVLEQDLRQNSEDNSFSDHLSKIYAVTKGLPAAIDYLVNRIENITKLTDFQRQ